jgi:hypothetical protein
MKERHTQIRGGHAKERRGAWVKGGKGRMGERRARMERKRCIQVREGRTRLEREVRTANRGCRLLMVEYTQIRGRCT